MCKYSNKTNLNKTYKSASTNPFEMDGFVELFKTRFGFEVFHKRYSIKGDGPPFVNVKLFINQKGKICIPSCMTYCAISFEPSATKHAFRIDRQWVELATMIARDMKEKGLAGPIALPPHVIDVRPWQWMGFKATVKYTYYLKLPLTLASADRTVKANINKAKNAGYTCSRSNTPSSILECLAATERRSHFDYNLDEMTLKSARKLLGDDCFRSYVCYAPDGEPVSSAVVLYSPKGWAADWVTGTKTEHLKSGVAQLLYFYRLSDLWHAGCVGLDMIGANIQSIAHMKGTWGGRLVPYYTIEPNDLKTLSKYLKQWIKFKYFNDARVR